MTTVSKHSRYMEIAHAISKLSKDTSTQVGAFILGPTGEGGPWGYNGAPRGCGADEAGSDRSARPEKIFWFEHAERNAIYNAARVGYPVKGSSLVVTHFPCMDCARAIVQAGIVKVITPEPSLDFWHRWKDHILRTKRLFAECNVQLILLPPSTAFDKEQTELRETVREGGAQTGETHA